MRRSASEIIRNLENRIARLENKSAMDPHRQLLHNEIHGWGDDYPTDEEGLKEIALQMEVYDEVLDILKALSSLTKYDTRSSQKTFFDKTFSKYVSFNTRRNSFILSGGEWDRVLMSGTLRDGYEDPHFMLVLEHAVVERDGSLGWSISVNMMFMSNDIVSHTINKGDDYRRELKMWLDS